MRKAARGDCYLAAFHEVTDTMDDGALVCHGTAIGTGGEVAGQPFGHAWVEFTDERAGLVVDCSNGGRRVLPRAIYYKIGKIENVVRYTAEEALAHGLTTEHYGPWA